MGWWHPPVPVKGERIGLTDNIANAVAALRKLDQWGGKADPRLRAAIRKCSDALEGLATADSARKAFERAANATGRLMPKV